MGTRPLSSPLGTQCRTRQAISSSCATSVTHKAKDASLTCRPGAQGCCRLAGRSPLPCWRQRVAAAQCPPGFPSIRLGGLVFCKPAKAEQRLMMTQDAL